MMSIKNILNEGGSLLARNSATASMVLLAATMALHPHSSYAADAQSLMGAGSNPSLSGGKVSPPDFQKALAEHLASQKGAAGSEVAKVKDGQVVLDTAAYKAIMEKQNLSATDKANMEKLLSSAGKVSDVKQVSQKKASGNANPVTGEAEIADATTDTHSKSFAEKMKDLAAKPAHLLSSMGKPKSTDVEPVSQKLDSGSAVAGSTPDATTDAPHTPTFAEKMKNLAATPAHLLSSMGKPKSTDVEPVSQKLDSGNDNNSDGTTPDASADPNNKTFAQKLKDLATKPSSLNPFKH